MQRDQAIEQIVRRILFEEKARDIYQRLTGKAVDDLQTFLNLAGYTEQSLESICSGESGICYVRKNDFTLKIDSDWKWSLEKNEDQIQLSPDIIVGIDLEMIIIQDGNPVIYTCSDMKHLHEVPFKFPVTGDIIESTKKSRLIAKDGYVRPSIPIINIDHDLCAVRNIETELELIAGQGGGYVSSGSDPYRREDNPKYKILARGKVTATGIILFKVDGKLYECGFKSSEPIEREYDVTKEQAKHAYSERTRIESHSKTQKSRLDLEPNAIEQPYIVASPVLPNDFKVNVLVDMGKPVDKKYTRVIANNWKKWIYKQVTIAKVTPEIIQKIGLTLGQMEQITGPHAQQKLYQQVLASYAD